MGEALDGDRVGPVLQAGALATAIVAAIRRTNQDVVVLDRGSYLRILVPWRCMVSRRAIESETGAAFTLPSDLEAVMPSFKGRLKITSDEVSWELARGAGK